MHECFRAVHERFKSCAQRFFLEPTERFVTNATIKKGPQSYFIQDVKGSMLEF